MGIKFFKCNKKRSCLSHPETFDGDGQTLQQLIDNPNRGEFNNLEKLAIKIIEKTKNGEITWEPISDLGEFDEGWGCTDCKDFTITVFVEKDPSFSGQVWKIEWEYFKTNFYCTIKKGEEEIEINKYSVAGAIIDEFLAELRKKPSHKTQNDIAKEFLEDLL